MTDPTRRPGAPRPTTPRPDPDEVRARNRLFLEEAASFGLVFRCPDCIHMLADSRECSLGYPNARLLHSDNAVEEDGEFMFCKYFEADSLFRG